MFRHLFVFCILLTSDLYGQTIKGVVLDSASREPIPYAHVFIANQSNATYTNALGKFLLNVQAGQVELTVSHVSYKKRKLQVQSSDSIWITLSQLTTKLPEIAITSLSAAEILKNVWKKNEALKDNNYQAKAFYRQVNRTDNSMFTEVHESFYELIYSNQGINKWRLDQGRYARVRYFGENESTEKVVASKNFSSLTKLMKMFFTGIGPIFPVGKHVKELYDVEITNVSIDGDETFLHISCKLKRTFSNVPTFEGTYIIRQSDYAICKFDGTMTHPFGIDKTIGEGYQTKNHLVRVSMTYDHDPGITKSRLKHVGLTGSFDYSYEKFKKWHNLTTTSNMYVYEYLNVVNDTGFQESSRKNFSKKDIDEISALDYNPDFWRNNQVVSRTPLEEELIKAFEKAKAFEGKMFKE